MIWRDDTKTILSSAISNGVSDAAYRVTVWYLSGWLIIVAIGFAVANTDLFRDDTDPAHGARSHLIVRVDSASGCQYLESEKGGITPRMLPNGKQSCRVPEAKQ